MNAIVGIFRDLLQDERGASMVEYSVLLALVTLTLIGAVTQMSTAMSDFFTQTASTLGSAK